MIALLRYLKVREVPEKTKTLFVSEYETKQLIGYRSPALPAQRTGGGSSGQEGMVSRVHHHFCGLVPNRLWPSTGSWTGGWVPLGYRIIWLYSNLIL